MSSAHAQVTQAVTGTVVGMAVAKAKGRLRGKPPKLRAAQEAHLVALYRAGGHTMAELADLFSAAQSTVYRALARTAPSPVDPAAGRGA